MKYLTLTIICLFTSLHVFSQGIVGTWSIDLEQTLANMDESQATQYEGLSDDEKMDVQSALSSQEYEFRSDATFTITNGGSSASGTWQANGSSLVITMDSGASITHTIESVGTNEWVLQLSSDIYPFLNKIAFVPTQN